MRHPERCSTLSPLFLDWPYMTRTDSKFVACLKLIRFDKPIGTTLLLWPTLWALWIANEGIPPLSLLLVFMLGTFLMRSAGCAMNDLADRHVDGAVERTRNRPLVTGAVSPGEALVLAGVLAMLGFMLVVLFTNTLTIALSFGGVALAACYPYMKRHTHLPQLVLGAAFSWGIPMAFSASLNELPPALWLVYISNLLWTVAYDTEYAMVDREHDLRVGVKSTAILFGSLDRIMIGVLQALCLVGLALTGQRFELGLPYWISLVIAAVLFAWQHYLIRRREPAACFRAFLHNNWVGMVVFLGVFMNFLLRANS